MGNKRGSRRVGGEASPLWAKVVVSVGCFLMVASIATVGYANMMLSNIDGKVGNSDLLGDGEKQADIEGAMNVLMVGSDKRADWNAAQADSIMIAHIDEDHKGAYIISIPRDLEVPIDGSDCGGGEQCTDKINSSFTQGGNSAEKSVSSLATTIKDFSDIDFGSAAMINFDGFTDVVETLGGVKLCLPFEMEVRHSKNEDYPAGPNGGRVYPEGCKKYEKKDVLPIVRERYAYGPETEGWTEEWGMSDYGRQKMQQHFIKQLLKEAKTQGYITNPTKIGTLVDQIGSSLLWDRGGHKVAEYAGSMSGINPSKMTTLRVPSEPAEVNGVSAVVTQPGEQEKAAEDLWKAVNDDTLDEWAKENPDWVNKDK